MNLADPFIPNYFQLCKILLDYSRLGDLPLHLFLSCHKFIKNRIGNKIDIGQRIW